MKLWLKFVILDFMFFRFDVKLLNSGIIGKYLCKIRKLEDISLYLLKWCGIFYDLIWILIVCIFKLRIYSDRYGYDYFFDFEV